MKLTKKQMIEVQEIVEAEGLYTALTQGYLDDISEDPRFQQLLDAAKQALGEFEGYVGIGGLNEEEGEKGYSDDDEDDYSDDEDTEKDGWDDEDEEEEEDEED